MYLCDLSLTRFKSLSCTKFFFLYRYFFLHKIFNKSKSLQLYRKFSVKNTLSHFVKSNKQFANYYHITRNNEYINHFTGQANISALVNVIFPLHIQCYTFEAIFAFLKYAMVSTYMYVVCMQVYESVCNDEYCRYTQVKQHIN